MSDSEQSDMGTSRRRGSGHIVAWIIRIIIGLPVLSLAVLLAAAAWR